MAKQGNISRGLWGNILLFGFIGQLAWAVENTYFNLFLYNYIGGTPKHIANMVTASAITAALTTIVMGALSDRVGKRKLFLNIGYIIWGLSTLAFAFISRDNVAMLIGSQDSARILAATVFVVIAKIGRASCRERGYVHV